MLINCSHYAWRQVTPEFVKTSSGAILHRFAWMKDEEIGELPKAWNHIVTEQEHDPEARLIHYSLGIPGFKHYEHCPYSDEWFNERGAMEFSSPLIKEAA